MAAEAGAAAKAPFALSYPFEHEGEQITALEMRRPKVQDLLAVGSIKDNDKREMTHYAHLCEVSPKVIGSLDMQDYLGLQAVYQGFLSQPTEPS